MRILKGILQKFGPGFITGASDDDPSGIATYTQAGARFGFGLLWTSLFMLPLMSAIQEMVGRIGMVSGQGLTAMVRKHLPRWVLYVFVILIVGANTINIGADLGAMADAMRLLIPQIPFVVMALLFTVIILLLEIFVTYKTYVHFLKWFGLALVSYAVTAILVTQDWRALAGGLLVPSFVFNKEFILMLVALLGTTISPYLFVWQSNEEVEEEISQGKLTVASRRGATKDEMRAMRLDTFMGMTFSQMIMFCIVVTAAGTFFRNGLYNIQTSAEAAQALAPLAGPMASLVFAIGVIGVGLMAVPVLSASASYAMSEAFGWKEGLYKKFKDAHGFYGIITVSTLIGLLINFLGINPIQALIWAAVLNGLATPPLIAVILKLANDKKVMGKWANGRLSNTVGILTLVLTTACAVLIFIL